MLPENTTACSSCSRRQRQPAGWHWDRPTPAPPGAMAARQLRVRLPKWPAPPKNAAARSRSSSERGVAETRGAPTRPAARSGLRAALRAARIRYCADRAPCARQAAPIWPPVGRAPEMLDDCRGRSGVRRPRPRSAGSKPAKRSTSGGTSRARRTALRSARAARLRPVGGQIDDRQTRRTSPAGSMAAGIGRAGLAEDDQVDGVAARQVLQQRSRAQGAAAGQRVGRFGSQHQGRGGFGMTVISCQSGSAPPGRLR